MSRVFRCTLEALDFLFFASHEAGSRATAEPYIHSTALLYALHGDVPETQRLAAGFRPFYDEDRGRFTRWATPAAPLGERRAVRISYNAVDETMRFSMEGTDKRIFPKFGAYRRFMPLSRWRFFLVSDSPPPRLFRLGKKRAQVRVTYAEASSVSRASGRFTPSHPVVIADLPPGVHVAVDAFCPMLPSPLAVGCELTGPHLRAQFGTHTEYIALPDPARYPRVAWPG